MGNAQYFRSQGNLPFNGDNQLAASSFQYDGNGNPTTYSGLSGMIFDPENHLTNVPGMMQAGYDSEGLRAWKQGSSTQGPAPPVYFLYDGDTAIVEEDINGNVLAWNGFGADGLRTRYTSNPVNGASQTLHYAFDPTGNLSNRLDPNGQASNTTVFDAFGQMRGQINTITGQPELNPDPVGFSGQWGGYTDPETKLVLLTHRYYDPSHGRWLNRDPIGYGGGLNLYGYCGNNPVNKIDPNGTDALIFWGTNRLDGPENFLHWQKCAKGLAKEYEDEHSKMVISVNINSGTSYQIIKVQRAYVVATEQFQDLQAALQSHRNIDTLIYVGHGSPISLCLSKYNLQAPDVARLDTRNVQPNAHIELDSCDTAGTTADGGPNIAQSFANHFQTTVRAYKGGSSFGIPFFGDHGHELYRWDPNRPRTLGWQFGASSEPMDVKPQRGR